MLQKQFQNQQINFAEKQKIIDQFEELKTGVTTQLELIDKKSNEILKQADAIESAANKIKDSANAIIENNKKVIINKIEKFNVLAKVKKIEKLNSENSAGEEVDEVSHLIMKQKLD